MTNLPLHNHHIQQSYKMFSWLQTILQNKNNWYTWLDARNYTISLGLKRKYQNHIVFLCCEVVCHYLYTSNLVVYYDTVYKILSLQVFLQSTQSFEKPHGLFVQALSRIVLHYFVSSYFSLNVHNYYVILQEVLSYNCQMFDSTVNAMLVWVFEWYCKLKSM